MGREDAEYVANLFALLRSLDAAVQREQEDHEARGDLLRDLVRRHNQADMRLEKLRRIALGAKDFLQTRRIQFPAIPLPVEAMMIQCHEYPNGSATFRITGGKDFLLTPRLAQLFKFLADGLKDGSDPRGLVVWRSKVEISSHLEKFAHRPITGDYVSYMIHRLRAALDQSDYDPELIQMHRQKGYRIALRPGGLLDSPRPLK